MRSDAVRKVDLYIRNSGTRIAAHKASRWHSVTVLFSHLRQWGVQVRLLLGCRLSCWELLLCRPGEMSSRCCSYVPCRTRGIEN